MLLQAGHVLPVLDKHQANAVFTDYVDDMADATRFFTGTRHMALAECDCLLQSILANCDTAHDNDHDFFLLVLTEPII
jgi:hypothetical protein